MGDSFTPVRHLKTHMKDLNLMVIVLDVGRASVTKDSHEVRTVKVADKSGSVNLSLWDEPGKIVQSGDIIRLSKCYTNTWKGCLTLYISKGGEICKVGDFCLVFSEVPFMSEFHPENQTGPPAPPGAPGGTKGPFAVGNNRSNNGGIGPQNDAQPQGGGGGVGGGRNQPGAVGYSNAASNRAPNGQSWGSSGAGATVAQSKPKVR